MTYVEAFDKIRQRSVDALKVAQSTQLTSVEITRELAQAFSALRGPMFVLPSALAQLTATFTFALLEQQVEYARKLTGALAPPAPATAATLSAAAQALTVDAPLSPHDAPAAHEARAASLSANGGGTAHQPVFEGFVAQQPVAEAIVAPQPVLEDTVAPQLMVEATVAPQPVLEDIVAPQPAIEDTIARQPPVAEDTVAHHPAVEDAIAHPAIEAATADPPVVADTVAQPPGTEENDGSADAGGAGTTSAAQAAPLAALLEERDTEILSKTLPQPPSPKGNAVRPPPNAKVQKAPSVSSDRTPSKRPRKK